MRIHAGILLNTDPGTGYSKPRLLFVIIFFNIEQNTFADSIMSTILLNFIMG